MLLEPLPLYSITTGTSPSQGATAAVCLVRLHSSVLLRTSVKCFFCLCPGCHHCRGATAAFHFSDQCHHRYQPFSRNHCCSVFGKTPFLGTFENKCEVFFFVFVQDATTVGEPLLLSTSPPCHQPTSVTTGTSPSQGATAAVFSVRLHSSVLLRTSVKCFFLSLSRMPPL